MALRMLYVVMRDLAEGLLTLRAMSLVYTTLLSLVPLIAFSFSVLKAFGVHNQIEPQLNLFLAPLGAQGEQIATNIVAFVDNLKVGVLGSVGLALLLYTVISMIQKVEGAFNFIWRTNRTRGFAQAFSDYLSVILIGPVLVFSALGITASIMNTTVVQGLLAIEPFGSAAFLLGKLVPYILICSVFTFVYVFVPNTKVRLSAALVGGLFAGVLWQTAGWGFALFVANSTKYQAIYSGFAILIVFLIWLYISWLILLIGAQVAFYFQHPQLLTAQRKHSRLSNAIKERAGLATMVLVGQSYFFDRPGWTFDRLVTHLNLDAQAYQAMLDDLAAAGLLIESHDEPPTYLPGRAMETMTVNEILSAIRGDRRAAQLMERGEFPGEETVDALVDRLGEANRAALGDATLRQLIGAEAVPPA